MIAENQDARYRELERKHEHQLRILHAIGVASPDFIYLFDTDQRFLYVSPPLLQLWGKTLDQAVGRNFAELGYPPDLVALHQRQLDEALSGKVVSGANAYVNKDGVEGRYEYTFVPVAGPGGRIETVVGTTRDVTQRHRAEREHEAMLERLRDSEEQFRHFAEAIPQLGWIAQADGYIVWYNRRWYDYTGTTPEQMEGWGWQIVHDQAELPRVLEGWTASIRSGNPFEMTFPLRGKDGTFRHFLTRVMPVRNARGEIVRWFGTNTDVEEQRRTLAERDAALARAEEAARLRQDFLAIASHELKTPLAALMLHVQGLERQAEGEPRLLERLQKASRAGRRLERLIRELLDVSRISRGELRLQPEPVELTELVREVAGRFQSLAPQWHIGIEGNEPLRGRWDPLRLDQVMTNLLDNALKYGDGKPVQVALRREGAEAVVELRDQGQGIAADQQQRVFERFVRAASPDAPSGFGLGLWIARQVVEASGGTISVCSQPGQGATFTVRLPLDQEIAP